MDYSWQFGPPIDPMDLSKGFYSSGDNKNKDKMFSLFKWQWDEMCKTGIAENHLQKEN